MQTYISTLAKSMKTAITNGERVKFPSLSMREFKALLVELKS